jgi:hypothetical protein
LAGNANYTIDFDPTGSTASGVIFHNLIYGATTSPWAGTSSRLGALHPDVSSRIGTVFNFTGYHKWFEDDVSIFERNSYPVLS